MPIQSTPVFRNIPIRFDTARKDMSMTKNSQVLYDQAVDGDEPCRGSTSSFRTNSREHEKTHGTMRPMNLAKALR